MAFDRGGHPPVDFIARLAALVRARPDPNQGLSERGRPVPVSWRSSTYAARPNHRWRGLVTPAKRGKGVKRISNTEVRSPAERHAAMTWAQRRVTHH